MKKTISALALAALAAAPLLAQPRGRTPVVPGAHPVAGELVLYGNAGFTGQSRIVNRESPDLGTPWAIRSLSLHPGDRWQICANPGFRPPCTILTRPIADAAMIGVTGQIGSVRPAPQTAPAAD